MFFVFPNCYLFPIIFWSLKLDKVKLFLKCLECFAGEINVQNHFCLRFTFPILSYLRYSFVLISVIAFSRTKKHSKSEQNFSCKKRSKISPLFFRVICSCQQLKKIPIFIPSISFVEVGALRTPILPVFWAQLIYENCSRWGHRRFFSHESYFWIGQGMTGLIVGSDHF